MARPSKKAPLTEAQKREREVERQTRFLETGEKRVNACIRSIRNIGKMGTSPNYSATPEQVEAMFQALTVELSKAAAAYQPGTKKAAPAFSFGQAS